ncbi:hypothetical protein TIFTF001_019441 [Ficus carica]|uniref:Uncharacterized protein n=1 Tax=Ficus carica TaxID=3494 RepID=A0AA88A6I5_FICCA|nr:hypothetical protein TIFTF001_019441 [Ficus carica]
MFSLAFTFKSEKESGHLSRDGCENHMMRVLKETSLLEEDRRSRKEQDREVVNSNNGGGLSTFRVDCLLTRSESWHCFGSARIVSMRSKKDEAHCKDYHIAGGHFCRVDRKLTVACIIFFPATDLSRGVAWMLWSIDGWSWSHALPNLSSRSCTLAAGHC